MALWLKNTSGQASASLTFATIGFCVVTLWLLVSIVAKLGHTEIRPFSGSEAMAYLTPLLALYFGRRWTDVKSTLDNDSNQITVTPEQKGAA
jgi:drug/metabolite transporter (DMT)-like permease